MRKRRNLTCFDNLILAMGFYEINLALLAAVSAYLLYRQHQSVGAYFLSMASLRGKLIQDGCRGRIYVILRLPLDLFVTTAYGLAQEGIRSKLQGRIILANMIQATNIVTMCS